MKLLVDIFVLFPVLLLGVVFPNNTIQELVINCRGKESVEVPLNETRRISLNGISQADISAIFSNADFVRGSFEFSGSTAQSLIFPKLRTIDHFRRKFAFSQNAYLKQISLPKLKNWIGFHAEISHNPQLQDLDLPLIEALYTNTFIFKNNSIMKSLMMSGLNSIDTTKIIIRDNPSLERVIFSVPNASPRRSRPINIDGKMIIKNNPRLKDVNIVVPKGIQMFFGGMEMINNRELEQIPHVFENGQIGMKIKGNPKLGREILEELRRQSNVTDSEIQEFGECLFKEPVVDLSLLDVCTYVYGNLTLARETEGETLTRLNRVKGDVFIGELTIERLDFLLETDIWGKFESSLCNFDYSRFKAVNKGVKKNCETTTERTETTDRRTTQRSTEMSRRTTERSTERTTETSSKMTDKTTEKGSTEIKEESTQGTEEMTTTGLEKTNEATTRRNIVTSRQLEQSTTGKEKSKQSFPYFPLIVGLLPLLVIIILATIFYYKRRMKVKNSGKTTREKSRSDSSISSRKERK